MRGESKSVNADGTDFAGAEFTVSSTVPDTGAAGTIGIMGATGVVTFGAGSIWPTGAVGITDFASKNFGSRSFSRETGTAGVAAATLGVTFAAGAATLSATGCGIAGESLAEDEPDGAGAPGCGAELIRSPGKRMPQKPTTDSVNSSSTYPLTLR
ncbi:MAG: hypothetical protein DMG53_27570 [Acidobacteria bacterium]|nr:MAG: hypothetical protein DMG53_27570 [Acidobacteriota bacterium]